MSKPEVDSSDIDQLLVKFVKQLRAIDLERVTRKITVDEETQARVKLHKEAVSQLEAMMVKEHIALIDYIQSEPTGALIMTTEQMRDTLDKDWRDEVIQYFFNTDSLMFNLSRKKEELKSKLEKGGE